MNVFNPDSWMDVAVLIIISLFSLIGTVAPILLARASKSHSTQLEDIKEQVKNSHGTNLRDDIDGLAKLSREGFFSIHRDLHGIREELRTERNERIEGDLNRSNNKRS